jgi:hypothetical protein
VSFLLQFQLPLLSLHKLIQLPSGPGTLSPTPPYEFPLPLGGYRASVWPVTKVPKLPTGLGVEYALKRIFECFSGLVLREPVPGVPGPRRPCRPLFVQHAWFFLSAEAEEGV